MRLWLAGPNGSPCPVALPKLRADLIRDAGSEDLQAILTRAASARAAARWFVRCGILEQFRTAHAINAEDIAEYAPFQALE